jgi:hypothetical protein
MARRLTRRTVLTGAAATASSPALAHIRGGGFIAAAQTITAVNLSGTTFLGGAGSAGTVIGTATVTLSPGSPPASGVVWSLTGTDAARFLINSSTGVLSVGASDQAVASYSINIVATRAGYTGSPFTQPETITGVSAGLTVNQNVTRPLGALAFVSFGSPGGTNDYPFANIIAAVTGGPANTTDHLQFWSSATGYVGSPWYLNNSASPPGSGISSASGLQVPSVAGTTWNSPNTFPPTPPVTSWELRFVNGVTNAVISSQPITIDILNGRNQAGAQVHGRYNPFFPSLGIIGSDTDATVMICQVSSGAWVTGGASTCPIVAGTMQVNMFPTGSTFPPNNTITIQYTIDEVPVGSIIAGPASQTFIGDWFLTIDTTTLADGTHVVGCVMIDSSDPSRSVANHNLPYWFRCQSSPFIVHNTGTSLATLYASAQVIPSCDRGLGPSERVKSGRPNWVTWPGFSALPKHNTVVPLPLPGAGTVLPMSDPSSPYHGQTPTQQRSNFNWINEGLGGASEPEYYVNPRFFTTKNGGVYAFGYTAETGQTLEGAYSAIVLHSNYDGQRNDCMPDPLSMFIDGHDGTYWVVFEAFGRVVKATHAGTLTTMAGGTLDPTKIGLNWEDHNLVESDLDPLLIQVGTIGSPSFGDLRGINDGCFDLTDTSGNTLIVANPIDHYIARITGLLSGPVTMTRICGQDAGLGGVQTDIANNGGYVDGPATEFVAGSSVATFNGTVTGSVLTVNSGFSGTLSPGCPLSWSGNLNTATGNMVTKNISGSGNGSTWSVNFASSSGAQSMTASTPVALLAGPYSVKMADGVHGPDPLGTLYIADYQNSALRKVHYAGSHAWDTVSTIFGNQTGALRWGAPGPITGSPIGAILNSASVGIASATWAANVLTIATSAPMVQAGVASSYGTIQPGWVVTFAGLTNSGSGGSNAVNATGSDPAPNFQVATVTDSQHFTVTAPAGAGVIAPTLGVGGATVAYWADDVYLPVSPTGTPRALNRGGAQEAYCPLPQRLIINSTGKLILAHTWFDCVTTVDLAASTIVYTGQQGCSTQNSRLNSDATRADPQMNFQASWFTIDVDSGVAGDVSAIGCVGPKDDIFMLDANGNITSYWYRCAADGSAAARFSTNDSAKYEPVPVGRSGSGHYNWGIGISRHQGRMLSSGLADTGINSWRAINPAIGDFFTDGSNNQNIDAAGLSRGYNSLVFGSTIQGGGQFTDVVGVFPCCMRPTITTSYGDLGRGNLNIPGHADTFDGVVALNPTSAGVAEFIKNGFGSVDKSGNPIAAPEFSIGGDDCLDTLYAVLRMSAQGSTPGGTAGGGFTPITPLVQRGAYSAPTNTVADVTPPVISGISATRTSGGATTILVTWTTDKATWGIVAAGFASAHGTAAPYHLFGREAFVAGVGNPSYGTSHSVTIQCYKDAQTFLVIVAKDVAGNNAISPEQTVAA